MYQIIGIVRKTGEYNGIQYDNTHLHCTREPLNSLERGSMVEIIKIKTDLAISFDIGDTINVYYDKFGKVVSIVSL